jgi:hypothetical protein
MADPRALYSMSWGRLRLFGSSVDTDASRTQVVHELASGDLHPTQDRGRRATRVRVALQFDDFPGQPSPLDAIRALVAAKNSGATALFTHPFEGNFMASIGEFNHQVDADSNITATAEFIADEEVAGVLPSGVATSATAGEGAVSAAADALDQELATVKARPLTDEEVLQFISDPSDVKKPPLTDDEIAAIRANPDGASLTDDARAASRAWADDLDTSTRTILIDTARISNRTALLIEEQRLEQDLLFFPAFKAAILFGDAVHSAALAATAETSSIFVMRIVDPTSLIALAARVYGGSDAEERARQILSLNDIPTPGWLAPGDYLLPSPTTARRAPF